MSVEAGAVLQAGAGEGGEVSDGKQAAQPLADLVTGMGRRGTASSLRGSERKQGPQKNARFLLKQDAKGSQVRCESRNRVSE